VTPNDMKDIAEYLRTHRENFGAFDIVFGDRTPADPEKATKLIQPYAETGLTWWNVGIWGDAPNLGDRITMEPPSINTS
jgi:hypothetical protein